MKTPIQLSIAAVLLLSVPAVAQMQRNETGPGSESRTQMQPQTQTQGVTTQDFVNQAWNISTFEIQAARAAEPKVKDKAFRDYSMMVERDHTKMNDDLTSIANKLSLTLPKSLDTQDQRKLDQLTAGREQDLEKLFRTQQIDGHKQAIKLFQSYAANGDNAELRNWAKNEVATLERHLDRAEALREPSGVM
jgi:putative membrane protein